MNNALAKDARIEQERFCNSLNVPFVELDMDMMIGVSKNFNPGTYPINGMRHPKTDTTTGWYIWSGEDFSSDDDFFEPVHAYHIIRRCPRMVKFLGLPEGFRFLYDSTKNYQDVWYDESLLDISDEENSKVPVEEQREK